MQVSIAHTTNRDKMKTMLYFTRLSWYEEAELAC
jgi:hypothetical protein